MTPPTSSTSNSPFDRHFLSHSKMWTRALLIALCVYSTVAYDCCLDTDCSEGLLCNRNVGAGYLCNDGYHLGTCWIGGCMNNYDCRDDQLCRNGVCIDESHNVGCETSADCANGFICNAEYICVETPFGATQACGSDADCPPERPHCRGHCHAI